MGETVQGAARLDCSARQSHGCVDASRMSVQTKFLRLRQPAALGDRIDGWRVCWLGSSDRCRVFFVVMVGVRTQHLYFGFEVCTRFLHGSDDCRQMLVSVCGEGTEGGGGGAGGCA